MAYFAFIVTVASSIALRLVAYVFLRWVACPNPLPDFTSTDPPLRYQVTMDLPSYSFSLAYTPSHSSPSTILKEQKPLVLLQQIQARRIDGSQIRWPKRLIRLFRKVCKDRRTAIRSLLYKTPNNGLDGHCSGDIHILRLSGGPYQRPASTLYYASVSSISCIELR